MARDALEVIDEIEAVRARNNKNWMDLLRLAYRLAPEEAGVIVRDILVQDAAVSALGQELVAK